MNSATAATTWSCVRERGAVSESDDANNRADVDRWTVLGGKAAVIAIPLALLSIVAAIIFGTVATPDSTSGAQESTSPYAPGLSAPSAQPTNSAESVPSVTPEPPFEQFRVDLQRTYYDLDNRRTSPVASGSTELTRADYSGEIWRGTLAATFHPTTEDLTFTNCTDRVSREGIPGFDPAEMVAGLTFCLVTDKGDLAAVEVISAPLRLGPSDSVVELEVTLWST